MPQRLNYKTIKLDDMRLFAVVAEHRSFTGAARTLGMPKQTLSRRVADLETALGVTLLVRTTRQVRATEAGAAYAVRCADLARAADDANRAAADADETPRGTLRVTADPVFGEAFVSDLVVAYARAWPEVRVDVTLTRRRVALVEEGFDVAFRVGSIVDADASLSTTRLGAARVRYCASRAYLSRHGSPASPRDLAHHACVVVSDGGAAAWPFRGKRGLALTPVVGRITTTSFAVARSAVLAGLGVAIFPEFACADDLRRRRLATVLDEFVAPVGSVWLLHARRSLLPARVRAFVELARARFATPPW